MIEQGSLLLVPFPFSDQSGRKVRPVIVLSNNEFNKNSEDLIVAGVTSNLSKDKYSIVLANDDLEIGKLLSPCCIKVENLLKVDKGIIIKSIGLVNKDKVTLAINILSNIFK